MLIAATQLSRYYGKLCAVNKLSFQLQKGQVLGFLGENGAGKTTTMQMLCGVLAPSSGQIHINGFDLLKHPQAAKQHLGYLPEQPPLYKELTVTEFLHYCGKLHGLSTSQRNHAVNIALEKCNLAAVSQRLIAVLSKGYQQRVGIAQAILHNPAVIILDEPTVGLDPIQIKEIRILIKQLTADHAVILSTHILSEVEEICSHVQIIQHGQLIFHNSIAQLTAHTNTNSLSLMTRTAIDETRLLEIDGVTHIETVAKQHYCIHHTQQSNPLETVTQLVINSGWGLEQITPIKRSLEDIFIALSDTNKTVKKP
jgi:ABC-2 type transport system ATP-binding protein